MSGTAALPQKPTRNRLVIRLLPPTLNGDDFWSMVGQTCNDQVCSDRYYVQGRLSSKLAKLPVYSRAYVTFRSMSDLKVFYKAFKAMVPQLDVLYDDRSLERVKVEYAPYQCEPAQSREQGQGQVQKHEQEQGGISVPVDDMAGTIQSNKFYEQFLKHLEDPKVELEPLVVPPPPPAPLPPPSKTKPGKSSQKKKKKKADMKDTKDTKESKESKEPKVSKETKEPKDESPAEPAKEQKKKASRRKKPKPAKDHDGVIESVDGDRDKENHAEKKDKAPKKSPSNANKQAKKKQKAVSGESSAAPVTQQAVPARQQPQKPKPQPKAPADASSNGVSSKSNQSEAQTTDGQNGKANGGPKKRPPRRRKPRSDKPQEKAATNAVPPASVQS